MCSMILSELSFSEDIQKIYGILYYTQKKLFKFILLFYCTSSSKKVLGMISYSIHQIKVSENQVCSTLYKTVFPFLLTLYLRVSVQM